MAHNYDFSDDGSMTAQDGASSDYRTHNREMNVAWRFLSATDTSVFLTGKAGTGKTTFLKRLRELSPKRMVVLAPTGVAAINAGGQTIHSFLQLPLGPFLPGNANDEERRKKIFRMSQHKKDLIRTLDLLVIDEISMVRADLLDQIDDALRRLRDRTLPFGGVQLLLIGDLMQLSPVARPDEWAMLSAYYDTPYFFSSHALQQLQYATIELKHIYRQQDTKFIDLLAKVRNGRMSQADIDLLNSRYIPGFNPQDAKWIRLTTHNHTAQQYNDLRMSRLQTTPRVFTSQVKGDFPESSYPVDADLTLKEGAQVMFVKNDTSYEHSYYNGKIGVITEITDTSVEVTCPGDPKPIDVVPVVWTNIKYSLDKETKSIKEEVAGEFSQLPLRLAWAITVHKSQGLTFDNAVLDINASFAHGQAYVALSRCRSLHGLVLSAPMSPSSVITDVSVNSYIDTQLSKTSENERQLPDMMLRYSLRLLDELYDFSHIYQDVQWLSRVVDEHFSRQAPELLRRLKDMSLPLQQAVIGVAARFGAQYHFAVAENGARISGSHLEVRIKDSCRYFKQKLEEIFGDLLEGGAKLEIRNKQAAQVYCNALESLRKSYGDKIQLLKAMAEQPFSTANYLNAKARALLSQTDSRDISESKRSRSSTVHTKEQSKKRIKGGTALETLRLFDEGKNAAEIAKERGLAISTILGHLGALISDGKVDIDRVVSPERREVILKARSKYDEMPSSAEFMNSLPDDYHYGEVRITFAWAEQN